MSRVLTVTAQALVGVFGVYWLTVWDTPILIMAATGMAYGAVASRIPGDWKHIVLGAVIGFFSPVLYVGLWFVLNLPPHADFDL